MTANWYRDRREAEALQRSLERFEALVREGTPPDEAMRAAAGGVEPALTRLLAVGVGLGRAAQPAPEPAFAAEFEERLRAARVVRRIGPRRSSRTPGLATLAAAACVVLLAGVLFAATRSLPGDALYGVKRASESAQVALASGPAEARMRLGFAEKRLEEVEGLVARARGQVVGVPGSTVAAATATDFSDPTLTALIKDTLEEAERQITTAADILISDATDAQSLGKLADIARKGSTIASDVAQELPEGEQPPVISTAVTLAGVEAQAKAALNQLPPSPTPPQCDTPMPEPTPTSTPTGTPEETTEPTATPSPSPEVEESPSAESPEPAPSSTPCVSPSPDPDATPSPTPSPTATVGSEDETDSSEEASPAGRRGGPSEGDQGPDGQTP